MTPKQHYERLQRHLVKLGFDIGSGGLNGDGVDGYPGTLTNNALTEYAKELYKKHDYKLPKGNGLTWFRTSDFFTDKFSDFVLAWRNNKVVSVSVATTKAGKYWVSNPVTVGGITGTGVQKEGQTLGSHKYIKGANKWSGRGYFRQIKEILIYRDGNKDNKLDKNIITKAPTWYGFFFHAMGRGFSVWNWSAGCLGAPKVEWVKNIDPCFNNGDIIDQTIIEVDF